jgi:hypothetical protein
MKSKNLYESNLTKYDDCYFGIMKSLHYGLEYVYRVILGAFSLEIKILNLHRNAD